MWANAQRDGRPNEYTWHPLFNTAKFGWRPLWECRAVTLTRSETHWNFQGCPKLANRSQPLVGWSSPYYQDMWRRYCCLTCLSVKDLAQQSCAMVPKWHFFASCISSEPRAAQTPSVQRRKVWLTPLLECRAVMLPRRETHWNLLGCPKLANKSQPLVGRSSPYCQSM